MKKTNGFTIVELLAVIIILALIMVIAIPAISGTSGGAKQKAFETKVKMLESAGTMYGQDYLKAIIENANKGVQGYSKEDELSIYTLTVDDLINSGYLENENDSTIISDPLGKYSSLNKCSIKISINASTKRVVKSEFIESTCE